MKYFAKTVVKPYIAASGYRRLCEIGASLGENTDKLLEIDSTDVTVVDPNLDVDLGGKCANEARVHMYKGLSLEVLPTLTGRFDCVLIDGDHNWYTVYHELKAIAERGLLREGGTIFLHDVGWPYGHRDMYYQPETIPASFILPNEKRGVVYGQSELSASGINGQYYTAKHEGGPKNGVLTAVEDFVKENRGEFRFFRLAAQYGLGVLLKTRSQFGTGPFLKLQLRESIRKIVHRLKR